MQINYLLLILLFLTQGELDLEEECEGPCSSKEVPLVTEPQEDLSRCPSQGKVGGGRRRGGRGGT